MPRLIRTLILLAGWFGVVPFAWGQSPPPGYAFLYRGGICVADGSGNCLGGDATAEPVAGPAIGYMKTSPGAGTVAVYRSTCYSNTSGVCTGWGLSLDVNGTPVAYLSTTAPDSPSAASPFTQSGGLLLQGLGSPASAYLWTNPSPTMLAITTQPGNAAAGSTIPGPPTVKVQDSFGNTVTSSSVSITIAIENNPGGGALSGTVTKNATAGVATFSDLKIDRVGTGYTLAASSSELIDATSNAFNITSPSGKDLVIEALTLSSTTVLPGGSLTVSYNVANRGTTTVTETYTERIYLSSNATYEAGDTLLGTSHGHTQDLATNVTHAHSQAVTIPSGTVAGSYYILVRADSLTAVTEVLEGNNVTAKGITVGPTGTVSGTVAEASDGSPISGALVEALQGGVVKASTASAANGSYSIPGLLAGTYDVQLTAIGYATEIRIGIVLSAGTTTLNFSLNRTPNQPFAAVAVTGYPDPPPQFTMIDTATNTVIGTMTLDSAWPVATTPDGTRAYVLEYTSVAVVDTATRSVIAVIGVGSASLGGIALSPDGTRVYVTNSYNRVAVIDTRTNAVVANITVGQDPERIAVGPSENRSYRVYVTNYTSGTVSVIDTATNSVIATVPVQPFPIGVTVTPDGRRAYVGHELDVISVIDTTSNSVIATISDPSPPCDGHHFWGGTITPDGRFAYFADAFTLPVCGSVVVVDTSTNAIVARVMGFEAPTSVAVNPNGTGVYVANYASDKVSVIDTATNSVMATITVGSGPYDVTVACGDERSKIIQEHLFYKVNFVPLCSYFTQTAHSQYFDFPELNKGDYSWALIKRPLVIPASSGYGLDKWRQLYGGPRIVNSAYRNPARNACLPPSCTKGVPQSRHMHGDAADLKNESATMQEWQNMWDKAWQAGANYVEPQSQSGLGHVHADWRFRDPLDYAK